MKKIILSCAAALFCFLSNAQVAPMTALNSGEISSLAEVKKVNIVYDYSDLGVGAFRKEQDYIDKRYKELEEKEKGRGDKFKESWINDRKKSFEPHFEELFKKYAEKDINMTGTNYSTDNEYTLVVHTVFIEPGVNIGIYRKPAYIDLECTFQDKTGKALCVFFVKNAVGAQAMGFDYDVTSRLVESYGKAAKMLVGGVAKERKKSGKK